MSSKQVLLCTGHPELTARGAGDSSSANLSGVSLADLHDTRPPQVLICEMEMGEVHAAEPDPSNGDLVSVTLTFCLSWSDFCQPSGVTPAPWSVLSQLREAT